MKTNSMKKAIMFATVSLMLFASTAFNVTHNSKSVMGDDYYFWVICVNGKSKTTYVSSAIYTATWRNECHKPAMGAFADYMITKYNIKSPYPGYNYLLGGVVKTKEDAQKFMNKYVADNKRDGIEVIETLFTYTCE